LFTKIKQHCQLNDVTGIHTAGPRRSHFTNVSYFLNFYGKHFRKDYQIGTLHCNWPMSAHASQAFSSSTTDSEDLPHFLQCLSSDSLKTLLQFISYAVI